MTFDPMTGEMTYTPTTDEEGTVVTVEYEVCNTAETPAVCDTATVTIEVSCNENDPMQDCDKDGNPNGTDPDTEIPVANDDGVYPVMP